MRKVLIVAMAIALMGFLGRSGVAFASTFGVSSSIGTTSYSSNNGGTVFTFTPGNSLDNLFGVGQPYGYYTWGINPQTVPTTGGNKSLSTLLNNGYAISSATLEITDLYNTYSGDILHVDFLTGPNENVWAGNDYDNHSDVFYGQSGDHRLQYLQYGNNTDYTGDNAINDHHHHNFFTNTDKYYFYTGANTNPYVDSINLDTIVGNLTTDILNGTVFGFGFDPDCYWYDNGIKLTINLDPPQPTPEPMTLLLFGTGLAGLAGLQIRKRGKS